MISRHQDMLSACTSGDVAALERLFEANNIRRFSKPVYISSPGEAPPTNELLAAAITNGHLDIVLLVLNTYEGINFYDEVITALVNHPDIPILEALYNYDNLIVQFEWDDHQSTFVTEACKQPPEKIGPLLHFLIEHDAALDVGGFRFHFAVWAALCGNQPLDVIEAMIKKGGPVTSAAMQQAVVCERTDVIDAFMRFNIEGEHDNIQQLQTEAEETGNTDVVKLVHAWTSNWGAEANQNLTMVQKLKRVLRRKD
ncbi:hypothetical protein EKO04_006370 [Ascochyta lentis]|uniref:Uncharacterized protein n=1 Tax=Ascochyta lentis TaxID=205686 RepID=A0A8H7MCY6_9PLEO|nr:hypothetical protein EKO04_006370 [Ascochyta lentis]